MKRRKYRVAPKADRTWRGVVYDSKGEMRYAQQLALDGTVVLVIEQPKLWLGVPENTYRPDFFVLRQYGDHEFVDFKGAETRQFAKNEKLWKKYGPAPLRIVKAKPYSGELYTDRIIEGGGAQGCAEITQ